MPVDELLLTVDRASRVAAHTQLEVGLRDAIRGGRLTAGDPVPSTRRLAEELGVARGVVVEAYEQLTAEGYLVSRVGGYTRVADGIARPHNPRASAGQVNETSGAAMIDLTYGRPDVSQFPRGAWLASMRRVLSSMPNDRLNYLDGRGAAELREVLSAYLARVRGAWIDPDDMVITNGYAQGIGLVLVTLAARGITRVAVEDPSDRDASALAIDLGFSVVGIPVEADGIDVAALAASGARAVIVTPAHQFPTGAVLSPQKRADLVAWANRVDGLIVEDDYDAEYRYDREPVGALQGLAPERVILAGTTSKTLAPGIRIGWLAAPGTIVDELADRKLILDRGSPVLEQLAFADFIASGAFNRHLRRMRSVYRHRRDVLVAAMAAQLPELRASGIAAGIHCYVPLPADLPEADLVAAARVEGLDLEGASGYRPRDSDSGALIIGYGKLDDPVIEAAVRALARAVRMVRGSSPGDRGA